MYWLELQDLMFFIKSLKEPPDNLNISDYVSFVSGNTRAASTSKLSIKYTYYRSSRHFFFTRIARLWNPIPNGTFSISSSLPTIKFQLYIYFLHHFRENFDSNNVYAHFIYSVLVLGAFQYNFIFVLIQCRCRSYVLMFKFRSSVS